MTTVRFAEQATLNPLLFTDEEEKQIDQLRSILQPSNIDEKGRPKVQCCRYLHIGLFFDGTNNNKYIATEGRSQSNVARLYELFPSANPITIETIKGYTNDTIREYEETEISTEEKATPFPKLPVFTDNQAYFQKVYIPGVGTPFPDIGDLNKNTHLIKNVLSNNTLGEGMAYKGNERIFWAIWQVVAILYSVKKMNDKQNLDAKTINQHVEKMKTWDWNNAEYRIRKKFQKQLEKYLPVLKADTTPKIQAIKLYVFGFSRGAAAARSFCTRLVDYLSSSLPNCQIEIVFLGIFDTVASVGIAHSAGKRGRVKNVFAAKLYNSEPHQDKEKYDGHQEWARPSLLMPWLSPSQLAPSIKTCFHMVSAHEVRGSFPLTSISGMSGNSHEIVYPGVHSDVGGGYSPCEQGKFGNIANPTLEISDQLKLSQIPLTDMYRYALLHGVPFLLPNEILNNKKKRAMVAHPKLIQDFNAYCAKTSKQNQEARRKTRDIIYEQYSYYLAWRKGYYERDLNRFKPEHVPASPKINKFPVQKKDCINVEKSFSIVRALADNMRVPTNKDFNYRDINDIHDSELGLYYEVYFLLGKPDFKDRKALFDEFYNSGVTSLNSKEMQQEKIEEWNSRIRQYWDNPREVHTVNELKHFFDHYVHDSRAWFRLEPAESWGYLRLREVFPKNS